MPSVRSDLDDAPALIGEIVIDVAGMLSDVNMHRALGTIKLRPRLKETQR